MSFLDSPQFASATTRLLNVMDGVMPRRHQLVLGIIIAFLTLGSIAGSGPSRAPVGTPAPIVVIITATPAPAQSVGLAKEAMPMVWRATPTAAPAPTIAPTEAPVVEQPVEQPIAVAVPTEAPLPTATLVPPWIGTRWTAR